MKKILGFILAFATVLCLGSTDIYAEDYLNPDLPRVVDEGNVLTGEEEIKLNKKIEKISEKYKFDIVIVTSKGRKYSDIRDAAEYYYDYAGGGLLNSYGYGQDASGIILFNDVTGRDFSISSAGYGEKVFNDYGVNNISDRIISHMKKDKYYDAYDQFLDLCEIFLKEAEDNKPYSSTHKYRNNAEKVSFMVKGILIGFVIGLIFAFCICKYNKMKMNTINKKYQAREYVVDKNTKFNVVQDDYLRSAVTKTVRDTGGGSSGGSSHRSSTGRSHTSSGRHY